MAGASSFAAITDWLDDLDEHGRGRLGFGDTVPVVTTMWRLLTRLDPTLLATVLAGWLHTRTRPSAPSRRYRRVIAVDGKPCAAAFDHSPRSRSLPSSMTKCYGRCSAHPSKTHDHPLGRGPPCGQAGSVG
ncbi:hypothetical protein [Paractinoplanes ferrugineus]|uniref:hypothetical protein n=1 Tax=Paractinoplanes ferrugineus TaxID=113564 RepID=UPI001EF1E3DB|nr:hypothetical protein [Actinoplanes ferrugineus]